MTATEVFPACAGMNQVDATTGCWLWRIPRVRGDEPNREPRVQERERIPRVRGDEPNTIGRRVPLTEYSPRARG